MAITLGCARQESKRRLQERCDPKNWVEKKSESEDSKRVKRTFRFCLACGKSKSVVRQGSPGRLTGSVKTWL